MSSFTPGPWVSKTDPRTGDNGIKADGTGVFAEAFSDIRFGGENARAEALANARLIAAAPTMADAIKGLIGLCQLLRNRDDCPTEIRQALTHNHRLIAAYEALSAAGIDGFQPSDFDADAKAEA